MVGRGREGEGATRSTESELSEWNKVLIRRLPTDIEELRVYGRRLGATGDANDARIRRDSAETHPTAHFCR